MDSFVIFALGISSPLISLRLAIVYEKRKGTRLCEAHTGFSANVCLLSVKKTSASEVANLLYASVS